MTRDEAYAWCKRTGALVNFAAQVQVEDDKGNATSAPGVLVQIERDSGLGPELEDAVDDFKTKVRARLDDHAKRVEA